MGAVPARMYSQGKVSSTYWGVQSRKGEQYLLGCTVKGRWAVPAGVYSQGKVSSTCWGVQSRKGEQYLLGCTVKDRWSVPVGVYSQGKVSSTCWGVQSREGSMCLHQLSSYIPTINHWNLSPYTPFLYASQKTTLKNINYTNFTRTSSKIGEWL